jgi:hypothetical protein
MNIIGLCLGGIVFVVIMGIKVLWTRPSARFPDPPPGYYDWVKKTTKPEE